MTVPLRQFLVDFSELRPTSVAVSAEPAGEPMTDPVAGRIEDARREALEQAREDADKALDALRADHAEHLSQERRRWTEHEGQRIGVALSDGLSHLEERIANMVAELLEPLLGEAVRLKAAGDLRATVAGVLANAGTVAVTMTGPDDLTAAARAGYPGAAHIDVQPGGTGDAAIRIGDTHIRTQLEAWTERLQQTLRAQS